MAASQLVREAVKPLHHVIDADLCKEALDYEQKVSVSKSKSLCRTKSYHWLAALDNMFQKSLGMGFDLSGLRYGPALRGGGGGLPCAFS